MSELKKCLKRFFAASLSLLLACSFLSVEIFAKENDNGELSTREQEILGEIYQIDPNYEYEGELVSVTKETKIMETRDQIIQGNKGSLSRASIGDNYMSIYVTTSRVEQAGKDTFDIKATATWKMVPFFRMQDAFAIAWGQNFALISSSATTSYKSLGLVNNKTSQISSSPNYGVGYSVESSDWYGQALDWVRISAKISQNNASGQANVNASYCHRKASAGGISVSLGGNSAGISFSVIGLSDTMSNYTSFSY